jgi:gamma-D-glutamyl-L-lysine dipeptidyl-peptidase
MKAIICPLSYIPIRKEPLHQSEQVSQLLFGETAGVIEVSGEWIFVETNYDNYTGWVEKKVVKAISENRVKVEYIKAFSRLVRLNGDSLWLSCGSEVAPELIDSQSATVITINPELNDSSVTEIALQYLGTPYLWGGRSFMGIDCSGFVQVVFKVLNIILPRDASEQVMLGKHVQFPSEAIAGDLAFFENEAGSISHVGILLEAGRIIHASGSVRIDSIDQQGIYNSKAGIYSHKLRVIKRIL